MLNNFFSRDQKIAKTNPFAPASVMLHLRPRCDGVYPDPFGEALRRMGRVARVRLPNEPKLSRESLNFPQPTCAMNQHSDAAWAAWPETVRAKMKNGETNPFGLFRS
jgi:hypothetical protein